MASCGSVVMRKSQNPDSGEINVSYTCQHGTVHNQRLPSVDLDSHQRLMRQIRDTGRLRERGLIKLKSVTNEPGPSNAELNIEDFYDCILRSSKRRNPDISSSDEEDSDTEDEWSDGSFNFDKLRQDSLGSVPFDKLRRDSLGSFPSWGNQDGVNTAEAELFRRMMYEDLLELDEELEVLDLLGPEYHRNLKKVLVPAPNYPCGPEIVDECLVCFEKTKLRKRLCCDFAVCDECMEKYLTFEVERGVVKIECINGTCDSYVHRDEILGRLPLEIKDKFYRFLIDANKDPNIKTCPRCSNIYNRNENGVVQNYGKYGIKVECPDCKLDWCFECQAPWHANIKCKDFRKGDELLKSWAKEHHFGHQNAQRCPKCKIFIERKGGCDHMVCTKCNTNFCYRCGDRFVDLKFFGNHLSRLSPLGCKYNYKPDEPVKRRLVRGSLLGAKLLGGVFLVGLGLAAGAILVGASVVILPVLGGIKYHRYRKIRRSRKRCQKLFSLRQRTAMIESLRERAVMERTLVRQTPRITLDQIHIGVQTGPAQQVDVTVHNPYHPEGPTHDADLNSEITMEVKDDFGQMTRTRAEVTPGRGNDEEGDVVLHVKTEPLDTEPSQNNPDLVKDSEKEASSEASKKLAEDGSASSRGSSSTSSRKSGGNGKEKPKRSRQGTWPRAEKKEFKKQEREHSMRKNKDNAQNNDAVSSSAFPDLGLTRSLNSTHVNDDKSLNDAEEIGPISFSETGCFLSLFKKPVISEKEKQSSLKTNSKENSQDIPKRELQLDCPDIVSCTLKASGIVQKSEYKIGNTENLGHRSSSSSELDISLNSDSFEHDAYLGMISTESYHTFL